MELEEIIKVAALDSELWVAMLAETMKTFPSTGSLNTEISDHDEVRPIFTDLVNDLRKLVKKQSETGMLPMECHYLNKGALVSVVGQQPIPTKHFNLKKKPKSAYLRSELLQKSNDAASNLKKASAPVIPVRSRGMPRKMTDTSNFFFLFCTERICERYMYVFSSVERNSQSRSSVGFSVGVVNEPDGRWPSAAAHPGR